MSAKPAVSFNASGSSNGADLSSDIVAIPAPGPSSPLFVTQATPTVAQFLDASTAEYVIAPPNPPGMTPFLVSGAQMQLADPVSGADAKVWLTSGHQVIIAYQGTTGGENIITNPTALAPQLIDDLVVFAKGVSPGETASLAFAKTVVAAAARMGIAPANVFVTGHSLGGIEAEYVAQQTGLGGIAFESTGIVKSATTAGTGANFVNVVTYGDPIGNYASDVQAEQPLAPAYAAGNAGFLPHYGSVVKVGDPAAAAQLAKDAAPAGTPAGLLLALPALVGDLIKYHVPGVQSHALGVTPYDPIVDSLGVKSGPVLAAANDTIPQLQAMYASLHTS